MCLTMRFFGFIFALTIVLVSCNKDLRREVEQLKFEKDELVKAVQYLDRQITYEVNPIVLVDGYESIVVGDKIWMMHNLNIDKYANGDEIQEITSEKEWSQTKSGAWSYYNNDPDFGDKYGKIYNWYAVNDPRGLCPDGWEVPSFNDWIDLVDYYGGTYLAPNALKSDKGWDMFNGKNYSNFNALPGGYRPTTDGISTDFDGLSGGVWWSSTSSKVYFNVFNKNAWGIDICSNFTYRADNGWYVGQSVRCIKKLNSN
jgi:uncharacterized protein (TIGR02145 family)